MLTENSKCPKFQKLYSDLMEQTHPPPPPPVRCLSSLTSLTAHVVAFLEIRVPNPAEESFNSPGRRTNKTAKAPYSTLWSTIIHALFCLGFLDWTRYCYGIRGNPESENSIPYQLFGVRDPEPRTAQNPVVTDPGPSWRSSLHVGVLRSV